MTRILVAGVGNIFLGDDGFGPEVAARIDPASLPAGVDVGDFGIAGVHLAYQLLEGYDAAVLIDALPHGGEPGQLCVFEPAPDPDVGDGPLDAHGMQPDAVLALLDVLGGGVERALVVGCQPESLEEGIGLSPRVAASVDPAVTLVGRLVVDLEGELCAPS
ncbi:MAG TPA: hydrogenase maturation protease [Acidimicrobiales bacterium]|nr:hydrogenase maturation protease [Acidimicrobiales bacterium]